MEMWARYNRLSIKAKFSLYGSIFILLIFVTSLQLYLHADNVHTTLENARVIRTRLDTLTDIKDDAETQYVFYIKSLTKPPIIDENFSSSLDALTKKAAIITDDYPQPVRELTAADLWLHSALQAAARHDGNGYRLALAQSYTHFDLGFAALRTAVKSARLENTQFRGQALKLLGSEPYKPFSILIVYLLLMAATGVVLFFDLFIPLAQLAGRIKDASLDAENARKYIFANPRLNEIGDLQAALNSLLDKVDHSLKHADATAALSNKRLAAIEAARDGIGIIDPNGKLSYMNPALLALHGIKEGERHNWLGQPWQNLYPEKDRRIIRDEVLPVLEEHGFWTGESPIQRLDGSICHAELSLTALTGGGFVGTARDISDRKKGEIEREDLQKQMMQSQKIEAIGRLTGGIAHDFNNMLTIIKGNLEIAQSMLGEGHETAKFMRSANRALQRSTELTQRLLAFSRSQLLDPQIIDLNKLIPEATMLILRAIGEQVEIVFDFEEDLDNTRIDAGQLENALLNLALNARDAMPAGGQITLKTANVYFDQKTKPHGGDVTPGSYVMIGFIDDGSGIAPEHLGRVFDPFFTTKGAGEGSGLGLSMVFGFVKQSNGHVVVESEIGVGTTVKMYFPRHEGNGKVENARSDESQASALPLAAHTETILVVEDEEDLLELNVSVLTQLGYRVHSAHNGKEALKMLEDFEDIQLVLTDIMMSGGITGLDVALKSQRTKSSYQDSINFRLCAKCYLRFRKPAFRD